VGVVAIHHLLTSRPSWPRALLGRADNYRYQPAPVRGTPPDDPSKAQFTMAGLLARESLPFGRLPGTSQWHWRRLVAYSCGGSAGVESSQIENARTGFPFHLPRGRTIV